jgi:hypothetical protein
MSGQEFKQPGTAGGGVGQVMGSTEVTPLIRAVDVIIVVKVVMARYGRAELWRGDNGAEIIAYAILKCIITSESKTINIT